jgi:hypothetical protein
MEESRTMTTQGIRQQLRNNLVAITSLAVAIAALGYNTWRNERTEHNQNVRDAGIELLREIASFQQFVLHAHFTEDYSPDNLRMGWAEMHAISDLSAVMPAAVARDAASLRTVWEDDADGLIDDEAAFRRIDGAIETLRQTTLAELRALR